MTRSTKLPAIAVADAGTVRFHHTGAAAEEVLNVIVSEAANVPEKPADGTVKYGFANAGLLGLKSEATVPEPTAPVTAPTAS